MICQLCRCFFSVFSGEPAVGFWGVHLPQIYWLEGWNPKEEKTPVGFLILKIFWDAILFLGGIFSLGESTAAAVWIFNQVCWLFGVVFLPQRSLGIYQVEILVPPCRKLKDPHGFCPNDLLPPWFATPMAGWKISTIWVDVCPIEVEGIFQPSQLLL